MPYLKKEVFIFFIVLYYATKKMSVILTKYLLSRGGDVGREIVILSIIILGSFVTMVPAAEKQNGVNYHPTWRGAMEVTNGKSYDQAAHDNMLSMGINWLAINVTGYQQTLTDTVIDVNAERTGGDGKRFFLTPSDEEIAFGVKRAHADGVKVMLKPYVTTLTSFSDPGTWHGLIGSGFTTEKQWAAWFASYSEFILHYAGLAQQLGVDQLCIGTELRATVDHEREWRQLIAGVRQVYNGSITYAAHHSTVERIRWWDALDMIGVDAYFPLTDKIEPSLRDLKVGWQPHLEKLAWLSEKLGKPILFTELGYSSFDGANREPWSFNPAKRTDQQEQADLYQAFFEEVYLKPWFVGVYWWVWYPQLTVHFQDKNFQPYGKPAEKILKKWYGVTP